MDGEGDGLLAAIALALAGRLHLLVLDTCERLPGPVRTLVERLLARAPSLAVLATSVAPVDGAAEALHALAPLPLPEAVRLFLDRAAAVAPDAVARLGRTDREHAERICARLDGLPLAVELAAARVRHLPLAELEAPARTGSAPLDRAGPPSRHLTLETAFAWTWDLLDSGERDLLTRLAALPGPFDLPMAEAVTSSNGSTGAAALVLRLLDRWFLLRTGRPGRTGHVLDAGGAAGLAAADRGSPASSGRCARRTRSMSPPVPSGSPSRRRRTTAGPPGGGSTGWLPTSRRPSPGLFRINHA